MKPDPIVCNWYCYPVRGRRFRTAVDEKTHPRHEGEA